MLRKISKRCLLDVLCLKNVLKKLSLLDILCNIHVIWDIFILVCNLLSISSFLYQESEQKSNKNIFFVTDGDNRRYF